MSHFILIVFHNSHYAALLLDTACKVLPLVVTISGRVGSDTPITCEHSGLRGVIVEETVLEVHFSSVNVFCLFKEC